MTLTTVMVRGYGGIADPAFRVTRVRDSHGEIVCKLCLGEDVCCMVRVTYAIVVPRDLTTCAMCNYGVWKQSHMDIATQFAQEEGFPDKHRDVVHTFANIFHAPLMT
eukprot:6251902-Amphidinium_carterae.1